MPTQISLKTLFKAMDPNGIEVFLEKDCWYGHILKRHKKQMSHRLYDIKGTIEKPDHILEKLESGVVNNVYFKRWKDRDPLGQEYLKVPTEVVRGKEARVLTAHPVLALPREDKKS